MSTAHRGRIIGLVLVVSVATIAVAPMTGGRTTRSKVAVAQIPLSFEVNRGQAAADARFVARGGGYVVALTDRGEPVLALHKSPSGRVRPHAELSSANKRVGEREVAAEQGFLRLGFLGGNTSPKVQGDSLLPGRSNYLIGNDPHKWVVGVPHYARVRYRDVYAGVDVLYYAKGQQLEYDFIVQPGTNPDSIGIAPNGAQRIERDLAGALVVTTVAGPVLLHKPFAYQLSPDGEREVACEYVVDKGEVRFALGDYDRGQVLRIDPVLSYAVPFDAQLQAIAIDGSGNSYLAGSTDSASFPTTPGVLQPTNRGNRDAVIVKLDPSGSLLFATYLGGNSSDAAHSIALDSSGNVIVAGATSSTDFPTRGAFQATCANCTSSDPVSRHDAFVSKLNPTGMQILYSTYLGGTGGDDVWGIALDTTGRVLMAGSTDSTDFPTTIGALQETYGGNNNAIDSRGDAFIAKLDPAQSGAQSLLFSTYLGGSSADAAFGIAVDASGFVFVTGTTRSANFPIANAFQSQCASCNASSSGPSGPTPTFDAFVTRLDATGTVMNYSTFLGGSDFDAGNGIALDSLGNAHVTGETRSSNFPTSTGAFQAAFGGVSDAFVTKLNGAGSALLYSSFVGGSEYEAANGLTLDGAGNAYVSGTSGSADFPLVNSLQAYSGGTCGSPDWFIYACGDAFVFQIDTNGSTLAYSTHLGGVGADDSGVAIAVDATGNAYVVGVADNSFPFTQGSLQAFPGGFVAKLSTGNAPSLGFGAQQVSFAPQVLGTTSTAVALLLRNLGSAPLSISGVSTTGDFAQTNNCGAGIAGGSSCTVQLTFAPATVGMLNGTLSVTDNAVGSPHSIPLSGTGVQAASSISLTPTAQTSASVSRGSTATFPLMVSQAGPLTSPIGFSCSGLPAGWSCGFSPTTVAAGSGPTQVMLALQTGSATAHNLPLWPIEDHGWPASIVLSALALAMLGIHLSARGYKVAHLRAAVRLGLVALLLGAAGCGGGSPSRQTPPPPPATVNITVGASSGSTTASTTLVITAR